MRAVTVLRCWGLFLLLFLLGCQSISETAVAPTPQTAAALVLSDAEVAVPLPSITPPPQSTEQPPTFTPLPVPTATATLQPTALPIVAVAVPEAWQPVLQNAIVELERSHSLWEWQLAAPETAVIQLVNDASGILVKQEPLALTVPFTADWEETNRAQAEEILQNGHNYVTVLPWSHLEPHQKALRVDGRFPTDPDYPFQDSYSLVAADGFETAAAELAAVLQASEPAIIHLAAVGDLMLARSLGAALEQGKLDYPFAHTADSLRNADITVGNVESALGNIGEPAVKSYPFQAPPEAAEALAQAGFDVVSLANNHAMDYGAEALLQAVSLLETQGVLPVGAGADSTAAHKPVMIEQNGMTVAFLSYVNVPVEARSGFDTASWKATASSPGMAWADPAQIHADVTAAAPQADLVIVLLHSGYEYVAAPSEPQTAAAHAAVDAGADVVIGHHAHILQGIEFYQDGVILYGTGNFAFEIDGDPETAVFHLWLDAEGVRQIQIEPAIIQFGGQPRPATAAEAYPIRQLIYARTNVLNPR